MTVLYASGQVLRPKRLFAGPHTEYFTQHAVFGTNYVRVVMADDALDIRGRRSGFAQVLDPVPDGDTSFNINVWNPATSAFEAVAFNEPLYSVRVWDIDAGAFVLDTYPQSLLDTLTAFRDWQDSGLPADPTTVLPHVRVRYADADSPPADVADLARVVEISGV